MIPFVHSNYVISFVIITMFLAFDFWTVKNISGRLLVGLRWWNEINEDGTNSWLFESKDVCNKNLNKIIKYYKNNIIYINICNYFYNSNNNNNNFFLYYVIINIILITLYIFYSSYYLLFYKNYYYKIYLL